MNESSRFVLTQVYAKRFLDDLQMMMNVMAPTQKKAYSRSQRGEIFLRRNQGGRWMDWGAGCAVVVASGMTLVEVPFYKILWVISKRETRVRASENENR